MSILEELARNRVIYSRMNGGERKDDGTVYGTGFTGLQSAPGRGGTVFEPPMKRLPPVSAFREIPSVERVELPVSSGVQENGPPTKKTRETSQVVYSLRRAGQADSAGGMEQMPAPLQVPELSCPETDAIRQPAQTDSVGVMAALSRSLEAEARHQPQLHREGGDGFA